MKMVANETELRNALKERAPEITIVTSYADTVKKKYGLDLKANPLGKMLVTGFGPVVNHFMNPMGEELSWYKIQFYTPGKLVIEREKYVERLQTTVDSYDIEQIETSLTAAKGIQNFFEHIPL